MKNLISTEISTINGGDGICFCIYDNRNGRTESRREAIMQGEDFGGMGYLNDGKFKPNTVTEVLTKRCYNLCERLGAQGFRIDFPSYGCAGGRFDQWGHLDI